MHHKVTQAIEHIETNFQEPLTVGKLARIIEVTPQYLCFLFQQHLGITPKQYIKRLRLQAGQDLLANTSMAVTTVGLSVGYRDPSRFMRDFKLAYGQTPAQYRAVVLAETAAPPPPNLQIR